MNHARNGSFEIFFFYLTRFIPNFRIHFPTNGDCRHFFIELGKKFIETSASSPKKKGTTETKQNKNVVI